MKDLETILIPKPQKIIQVGGAVEIGKKGSPCCIVSCRTEDAISAEAVTVIKQAMTGYGAADGDGTYPVLLRMAEDAVAAAESYKLTVSDRETVIEGADPAGLLYGAYTFSQMPEVCGDRILLPVSVIEDFPDFKDRGQYLECRYGSDFMTLDNWKEAIDYFARLKQNQLTIGVYGCWSIQYDHIYAEYLYLPFRKYPQLKTPRCVKYFSPMKNQWVIRENVLPEMYENDFFGDICAYAKKKNIKIKPLFNSLGHNRLIPRLIPEISAKYADGTPKESCFCTENEQTYRVMFDLYDEIIDRYLKPNGLDAIEIGLDEVGDFCECPICRQKKHETLMVDYIVRICKHLKDRGMKSIYVYYDMLYHAFGRSLLDETLQNRLQEEGLADCVVIDWWTYGDGEAMLKGTNSLFRSIIKPMTGYYHWVIPTENNENIRILAREAKEKQYEGIEPYGAFEYCFDKNFCYAADLSWNTNTLENPDDFNRRYAQAAFGRGDDAILTFLSIMRNLMAADTMQNRMLSTAEYYFHSYYREELPYPRNYPSEVFEAFLSDRKQAMSYLEDVFRNSERALEILKEGEPCHMMQVWHLTARHYHVLSDFCLTFLRLDEAYAAGQAGPEMLLSEVQRLRRNQSSLMAEAEQIRMPGNAFHYLRNLSILLVFFQDFEAYLKQEISAGRRPCFDLLHLETCKTAFYDYLR